MKCYPDFITYLENREAEMNRNNGKAPEPEPQSKTTLALAAVENGIREAYHLDPWTTVALILIVVIGNFSAALEIARIFARVGF